LATFSGFLLPDDSLFTIGYDDAVDKIKKAGPFSQTHKLPATTNCLLKVVHSKQLETAPFSGRRRAGGRGDEQTVTTFIC
jgi:hypothetical protein